MENIRLFELLKKRLFLVLTIIILAVVAAGATCMFLPVKYQAKAVLRLDRLDPGTGVSHLDYNSLMMYRQLARTYGELATSETVLQKLSGQVNYDLDAEDLRQMVKVSKVKDLELLEILVLDTSPVRAAYIANSLAELMQQEEKDVWKMNNLRLITPALSDGRPVSPNVFLSMLIAGLAGLLVSVVLLTIMEYPSGRG